MTERNINLEEVQETIEMPEYTVTKNNKVEAHKNLDNKSMKIVYSKEGNFIKVITVVDKWK
jgi:SH3-like domain-containing protein